MSGYTGNPDAESEHALILSENAIHESQLALQGRITSTCEMCGESIAPARVAYAVKHQIRCTTCIACQQVVEQQPRRRIKMLDRIL